MAEQQSKRTPVCFFLVALECRETNLKATTSLIRNSRNNRIRFAPLVGFTEVANPELIRKCLKLGFDDIVLPPFTKKTIAPRLAMQLGKPITYCETRDYFGPCRAVITRPARKYKRTPGSRYGHGNEHEDEDEIEHEKITFIRNLDEGIRIMKGSRGGQALPGNGQKILARGR